MTPKIIGAILIIATCGGMGLAVASAYRQKERMLQQMITAVQYMTSELQFRQTALPQLMRLAAQQTTGLLARIFWTMEAQLEQQLAPNAAYCMEAVLSETQNIPDVVKDKLLLLGNSLGRFDLTGQLSGLEAVAQLCKRELDGLLLNRDARLRSYATLGLCAGVALVILFI